MSENIDIESLEHEAQVDAIRSIKVQNLRQVGPAPVGRWVNIGIGRKSVMDALGLSGDEAAAILGEHLGKTIPFRFASWSVAASIKIDNFAAQPMINLEARDGAPDFTLTTFRGLFFWGENVDHLQWSTGTFGGATGARWHIALSGRNLTFHEFTVHGTVIDDLALHRALGLPHDEKALTLDAPSRPVSPVIDVAVKNTSGASGSAGRPRAGEGTWETQLFGELLGRATGGGWTPGGPTAFAKGGATEIKNAIHDWLSENNHEDISDTTAKLIAARLLLILREIRKTGG